MLTTGSGINSLPGENGQLNLPSATTNTGNSQSSPSSDLSRERTDEISISQKAKQLSQMYRDKKARLEQDHDRKSEQLEREYSRQKKQIDQEFKLKQQSLDVDIYI